MDFKEVSALSSNTTEAKEKARKDILKDIAALANGEGGALLIGVKEAPAADGAPLAGSIVGIENPGPLQQAVDELSNSHLDIRPAALRFKSIECDAGRFVLIVEVPKNTYSLSMVTYNNLDQFWIRRGWSNRPMTTDEIQDKFHQFDKVRKFAREELKAIYDFFLGVHKVVNTPLVWFAGVPMNRSRDHVPVDIGAITELLQKSSYFSHYPQRDRSDGWAPSRYKHRICPSLRGITLVPDNRAPDRFEIRRDGTLIYAYAIRNTGERTLALNPIYEVMASGLYLFGDILEKFGVGRVAVVQAGLIGCGGLRLGRGDFDDDTLPPFKDVHAPFDPVTLDESISASDVFQVWARQMANALQKEEPVHWPPWVP